MAVLAVLLLLGVGISTLMMPMTGATFLMQSPALTLKSAVIAWDHVW